MVEGVVTASIAVVAGCYTIVQGLHRRVNELDRSIDRLELSMTRDFVNRQEYIVDQGKLEEHMIRIERKLDVFIQEFSKR